MEDETGDTAQGVRERAPQGFSESLLVNCRPQPAIPAVFAFALLVALPLLSVVPGEPVAGWVAGAVVVGLVLSCALAVAAGHCSLVPQLAWLLLAAWALSLPGAALMPGWVLAFLYLGLAVAAAMVGYQLWRIRTRRFVPTVREPE